MLYFIYGVDLMFYCFFFFKQKTAYEMRISDWSSDVCSSDLIGQHWIMQVCDVDDFRVRLMSDACSHPCFSSTESISDNIVLKRKKRLLAAAGNVEACRDRAKTLWPAPSELSLGLY